MSFHPAKLAVCLAWVALTEGCSGPSSITTNSTTVAFPLGNAVTGVTLAGELAGKTMYLLPSPANHSHCWQDSVFWNGTYLFFGLTAMSWTAAAANTPAVIADPLCSLPAGQLGASTNFNVYSGVVTNGVWSITNLAINSASYALAAPKLDANTLVAVNYSTGKAEGGNIYLSTQTGGSGSNVWGPPTAFSQNSATCAEDNPDLYAGATQMIFESNRTVPAGTSCNTGSHQRLWISTSSGGTWGTPIAASGAPATLGNQAFQPWIDETSGSLYWTGDSYACGGAVLNCVLTATPNSAAGGATSGAWNSTATQIITPTPLVTGADGKVVLVGQYTRANGYAVMACGIATDTDPTASTPSLLGGRWTVYISNCAVPL